MESLNNKEDNALTIFLLSSSEIALQGIDQRDPMETPKQLRLLPSFTQADSRAILLKTTAI